MHVGVNAVGAPFVYQWGAVVTDPCLPIQNVDATVEALAAFYGRSFSFFGRSATSSRPASAPRSTKPAR